MTQFLKGISAQGGFSPDAERGVSGGRKVLIFSTAYYPFVGGAEVAVKEITDRLTPLGGKDIQFDMITARLERKPVQRQGGSPKFERIGNVNVYRVGIGWPKFDKYLLAFFGHRFAQKLHKKNNYNLIWSIMASYGGFAAMFFKKKNPRTPFLLTLQEGDAPKYIKKRVGFLEKWFRRIFTNADYIQCISNFLADWAKEMGVKCPIEVVPNGVDIEKFKVFTKPGGARISNFKVEELRQKLGIKSDDKILITTSRLVPKNGVGDIIEALQYLPENIKFLIIGDGPLESDLKFKIKNLKLEDRVKFVGYVSHDDLPKYLYDSDIFIRPSLSEGMGNSFIEAMAVGVPVIATPVGGIPDFLKDRETGLFCEINNPRSIAEKVIIYFEDDELRKKIIANALEMVIKNYDWNLIVEKMRRIFKQNFV